MTSARISSTACVTCWAIDMKRWSKAVSYEVTDPTIDSQIVTLRASNADVLISGVTAKFAAQAIPQGL